LGRAWGSTHPVDDHIRLDDFSVNRMITGAVAGGLRVVVLHEDAFAWAVHSGVDHRLGEPIRDGDDAGATTRVVARDTGRVAHVGQAVLQKHEALRAVVGAQAVAGAEILVDPHPHYATTVYSNQYPRPVSGYGVGS
jgi:hypothetical protein